MRACMRLGQGYFFFFKKKRVCVGGVCVKTGRCLYVHVCVSPGRTWGRKSRPTQSCPGPLPRKPAGPVMVGGEAKACVCMGWWIDRRMNGLVPRVIGRRHAPRALPGPTAPVVAAAPAAPLVWPGRCCSFGQTRMCEVWLVRSRSGQQSAGD